MRYPPGHRQESRSRILHAAAELFRRNGIAATGVDRVMARAGFTAGGFYGHFASKDGLVAAAVDAAAVESSQRWYGRFDELRGRAWATALVETYLSTEHRDDRSGGCILPSLGGEIARSGGPARLRFERRLRGLFDFAALRSQGELPAEREEFVAAIALCVGGLLLSRAVKTPALSREILAAARAGALRLLGVERSRAPSRRARPAPRTRKSKASARPSTRNTP
ncbi:MAG TPA: helix-turn-helix domain-containing protein [Polyangiaceae bacterium]